MQDLFRTGFELGVALLFLMAGYTSPLPQYPLAAGVPHVQEAPHGEGGEDDPRLEQVRRYLGEASFDSALVTLQRLKRDEAMPLRTRQEVYHLLGLVYTIMQDRPAATEAIRQWIALEPPRVSPDPDRDLLEFIYLYYAVRKAVNEEKYCPPGFRAPDPCQYGEERPDPGIKTIAVIDFDNNSIDDRERLNPLRGGLSDLMIRRLSGVLGLKIVERERIRWLLREIDLQQTGKVEDSTAVRLGKLLGVHAVLLGDYMYFNGRLVVGVRLVKVETGEILMTTSRDGKLKDFNRIVGELGEAFVEAVGLEMKRGAWQARRPTNELDALLNYAEGLALYDAGNHRAAAAKFEAALALDPNDRAARQRYQSLRPVLARASVSTGQ